MKTPSSQVGEVETDHVFTATLPQLERQLEPLRG
jgi:hypothetical protein